MKAQVRVRVRIRVGLRVMVSVRPLLFGFLFPLPFSESFSGFILSLFLCMCHDLTLVSLQAPRQPRLSRPLPKPSIVSPAASPKQ